ncbi:MAG: hypothetical protein ACJAYU_000216 [Bradymonadia bacterium]|jgi:hypothetical protein
MRLDGSAERRMGRGPLWQTRRKGERQTSRPKSGRGAIIESDKQFASSPSRVCVLQPNRGPLTSCHQGFGAGPIAWGQLKRQPRKIEFARHDLTIQHSAAQSNGCYGSELSLLSACPWATSLGH